MPTSKPKSKLPGVADYFAPLMAAAEFRQFVSASAAPRVEDLEASLLRLFSQCEPFLPQRRVLIALALLNERIRQYAVHRGVEMELGRRIGDPGATARVRMIEAVEGIESVLHVLQERAARSPAVARTRVRPG